MRLDGHWSQKMSPSTPVRFAQYERQDRTVTPRQESKMQADPVPANAIRKLRGHADIHQKLLGLRSQISDFVSRAIVEEWYQQ